MKLKLLFIFALLYSIVGCRNNYVALIGHDYILNCFIDGNTNSDFLTSKMYTRNLYYYLDKNASSISANTNINEVIRKSDKVILSFGIYDLVPLFDFSKNEIKYNEELISQKLELIDYYVYNSFSIINELINSKRVFVIKQYNPLISEFINKNSFEDYIKQLNDILIYYCNVYEFNFLELNDFNSYLIDDFVLKESIKKII